MSRTQSDDDESEKTTEDIDRAEFEALKERVAELESLLTSDDAAPTAESPDGLDHRDMSVVAWMQENGWRSGYQLVQLYQRRTDITSKSTAKRRAKALESHPVYGRDQ